MKKTICLCMIVKDESSIIRRCFDSVKSIIDYWVISDTGSTDGTQDLIKEFSKEVPGELHEHPWKNFAWNRSEAIKLARTKADYTLIIDADEVLYIPPDFKMPELTADYYNILTNFSGLLYNRIQLVKNTIEWRYESIIHEYITCDDIPNKVGAILPFIENRPTPDGNRSRDPFKYKRDSILLESAMLDEPNNTRYMFYLAQSYKDCGDYEKAIQWYKKRIEAGGWKQEVFYSYFSIARCMERMEKSWNDVLEYYLLAHNTLPHRLEPLFEMAKHYRMIGLYQVAYGIINMRVQAVLPDDLFVENHIYRYAFWDEFYITLFYLGKYDEAYEVVRTLFTRNQIPNDHLLRMYFNMEAIKTRIDNYTPIDVTQTPNKSLVLVTGMSAYGQMVIYNLLSLQSNVNMTSDRFIAHMNLEDPLKLNLNHEQINIMINSMTADHQPIVGDASAVYLKHLDYIVNNVDNVKIVLVKQDSHIINLSSNEPINNTTIDNFSKLHPSKIFACDYNKVVEDADEQRKLYAFIGIENAKIRVNSFVNVLD